MRGVWPFSPCRGISTQPIDNFVRLPNGHLLSGCVHNIWRVAKYVCVTLKSTFLHLSQMASYIRINDMYNCCQKITIYVADQQMHTGVTDLPLFLLSSSPLLEARRLSPIHLSYFLYFI